MKAKLGNQQQPELEEVNDVSQGLKPSATNKTKELSLETVSLY